MMILISLILSKSIKSQPCPYRRIDSLTKCRSTKKNTSSFNLLPSKTPLQKLTTFLPQNSNNPSPKDQSGMDLFNTNSQTHSKEELHSIKEKTGKGKPPLPKVTVTGVSKIRILNPDASFPKFMTYLTPKKTNKLTYGNVTDTFEFT